MASVQGGGLSGSSGDGDHIFQIENPRTLNLDAVASMGDEEEGTRYYFFSITRFYTFSSF